MRIPIWRTLACSCFQKSTCPSSRSLGQPKDVARRRIVPDKIVLLPRRKSARTVRCCHVAKYAFPSITRGSISDDYIPSTGLRNVLCVAPFQFARSGMQTALLLQQLAPWQAAQNASSDSQETYALRNHVSDESDPTREPPFKRAIQSYLGLIPMRRFEIRAPRTRSMGPIARIFPVQCAQATIRDITCAVIRHAITAQLLRTKIRSTEGIAGTRARSFKPVCKTPLGISHA
jgi:hypothetical protein